MQVAHLDNSLHQLLGILGRRVVQDLCQGFLPSPLYSGTASSC